jgi:hypothetical protein
MSWVRRNIKILAPVTLVVLAAVAYLAFAVFGVHTLFIDDKVDEDGPVFASGAAAPTETLPEVYARAKGMPIGQGRTLMYFCPHCLKVLGFAQGRMI